MGGRSHARLTAVAVDAERVAAPEDASGRLAAVLLVGEADSQLNDAHEDEGLTPIAVAGDDAAVVARLAVQQLSELRSLRARADARAATERAKGVLMARHGIGERDAFQLLRRHARATNRKLADVVAAVLVTHPLFDTQHVPGTSPLPSELRSVSVDVPGTSG
jgi:hypothetical protein